MHSPFSLTPPNRLQHWPLLAALATSLIFTGCSKEAANKGKGAREGAPVPVQVAKVLKQSLPLKQSAIGTVQCQRSVAVKSQVDGIIQQIHIQEGDDVKAGDRLVTLDRRPLENALRIAEADLANALAEAKRAENDAIRYQQLDQQQAVSKEQFALLSTRAETTRAAVKAKQASVANAQLMLDYTEIKAPFAGRTGQLNLREGSLVKANDSTGSIITINQLSPILVAFSVPESSLNAIRAAQAANTVVVKCTTRDNKPMVAEGKLVFVDNAVDNATGMVLLKAVFENKDMALWPGRFVDVETFLGSEPDALLVPSSAVQIGQRGTQVFVVKEDKSVDLRKVVVGRNSDGLSSIKEGVKEGETVVTDGQLRLLPGSVVQEKILGQENAAPARKAAR